MSTAPRVHLVVIQPTGYIHALGFIDQARYLRFQLRRLGAEVSLAKNRLRQDAVNIVFGAHLGFETELLQRHSCIFFNLEQLGQGGAQLSPAYLELLRHSAVVDYSAENLPAYCEPGHVMPVVPFLFAPYLRPEQSPPLEERPIDLLFFGSMNPRRRAFIDRIESTGRQVSCFDRPLYGPERDAFIRQAKAVVNCHFYECSRFEQVRASHCLSLGTPFISGRGPETRPAAAFEEAVFWLDDGYFERFFIEEFAQPAFFESAYEKVRGFQRHDPISEYADLFAFADGFRRGDAERLTPQPWRPTRINLGSGKDYKPGWLNIDVLGRAEPDLVLDLGQTVRLPIAAASLLGGQIELAAGSIEHIYANNVLEHVPDLPMLMGNALALLKEDGIFEIEVPYEKAPTAWQDPTHLRALNENSWLYYTDWFWYLGWFEHRFSVLESSWLDLSLTPCAQDKAAFMRVTMKKQPTTAAERMTARTLRADSGGIPDDLDIFDDGVEDKAEFDATTLAAPLGSADSCLIAASCPTSPAYHAAIERGLWLVLTQPHPDQVTTSFARAITAALVAGRQPARVVHSEQDLASQLRGVELGALAGVICIGTPPLMLRLDGRLLHQQLRCPVYAYFLDSPIYDIARVPAARQFIQDAWHDPRLVPLLAERSYLLLLRKSAAPVLPPQSLYLPFAAFPANATVAANPAERNMPPTQRRLLVVGSLGQELSAAAVRPDLLQTLRGSNQVGLTETDLLRISERLLQPLARGNCAADLLDVLGLTAQALLNESLLNLCCAADSFIKRSRRLLGIEALRGLPVDFIGSGWEEAFRGQRDFRFLGSTAHGDLAPLIGLYRGLLNFDPNWEWGMHDRVYTALNAGVPVMTHANAAIAEERLAGPLLHTFAPNAPVLAEIGAALLAPAQPPQHAPVSLDRIGWPFRLRQSGLA